MKLLSILMLMVLSISCSKKDIADSIYFNGDIITMDDSNPQAQAVALLDGKILAVGGVDEIKKYIGANTVEVDLEGKTLLPGFVDPHSHVSGVGILSLTANLYPSPDGKVNSINDIVSELSKYYETNPALYEETGYIIGYGYDDALLEEGRHPTKEDLDKAFGDVPVYLVHQSGHLGVANSKALEKLNINASSENPAGGIIQRVEGSDEPTGLLEENAHLHSFFKIFSVSDDFNKEILLDGMKTMASHGYTTVQEGRATEEQMDIARVLANENKIFLDLAIYPDVLLVPDYEKHVSKEYENNVRVAGGKITLDGSPQGKTAWRDRPYVVPPHGQNKDYVGYPSIDKETLFREIDKAFGYDIQILAHANGEAAIDLLIEAVASANETYGMNDRRPVLIHGQFTREDQVYKIKEENIFASLFPLHTYYWGDWHSTQTIGEPGVNHISPTGWFLETAQMFTTHHDSPVTLPNSMRVLWATVNRVSRTGKNIGTEQQVSVMDTLKAMTIWSAYQYFEENTKGSIEVGKVADFVILTENPLTVPKLDIIDIDIVETIKGGNTVYKNESI